MKIRIECLAVALAAGVSSQAMASVVAAEHLPASYGSGLSVGITTNALNFNIHGGQTFLTTVGGPLESISIWAFRAQDASQDLEIELYSLTGAGTPDTQLATGLVVAAETPYTQSSQLHTVDFTASGVNLEPGTRYAIVIGQEESWSNTGGIQSWALPFATSTSFYNDGTRIQSNNGGADFFSPSGDIGFRVTVPAPGAAAVLGMGVLGASRRRRLD